MTDSSDPLREHKSTRKANIRVESLAAGAKSFLGKAPNFLGISYTFRLPHSILACFVSAIMFFSSLSSRLRGPNRPYAESAMDSATSRASPPGSPPMVVPLKIFLLCLITLAVVEIATLASAQLAATAEFTPAESSRTMTHTNSSLLCGLPSQTFGAPAVEPGGGAPVAPSSTSPRRSSHEDLTAIADTTRDRLGCEPPPATEPVADATRDRIGCGQALATDSVADANTARDRLGCGQALATDSVAGANAIRD